MRRFSTILCVMFVAANAASAQTITINPSGDQQARAVLPNTRIQVQMQLSLRGVPSNTIEEQRRAQQSVREGLYEMAAGECTVIGATFKADCKLTTLNINSNVSDRGNFGVDGVSGNANATYELTPRKASP
jgi:hypothetical protein